MKQYAWETIQELFSVLNEKCNYLIMRNYEEIAGNQFLMTAHPDIDLLCDNPQKLKKCLNCVVNLGSLSHKNHYWVKVGNCLVQMGIRSVGDNYYDAKWAQTMLRNKVLHPGGFYIMDDVNYFYSLIYHAAFQKNQFSEDYLIRLHNIASTINIDAHAKTEEFYTALLLQFMRQKRYYITCPTDITIPLQFHKIPVELLQGKLTWKYRRILHFPERAIKFTLRRLLK